MADRTFHHQIQSLAGTLDQSTFPEHLGETPIARILLVDDVGRRYTRWKSARTDDLEPAGILPHENRATEAVIAMGDGVEQGLAHRSFVEGVYVVAKQPFLITLLVVAQVDQTPDRVLPEKKTLAKFRTILCRTGCFGRTVFKDQLGLRKKSSKRPALREQDQAC